MKKVVKYRWTFFIVAVVAIAVVECLGIQKQASYLVFYFFIWSAGSSLCVVIYALIRMTRKRKRDKAERFRTTYYTYSKDDLYKN